MNDSQAVDKTGDEPLEAVILSALFEVPPCTDSTEAGRACRRCEAPAVALAVSSHLLKLMMTPQPRPASLELP